MPSCKSILSPAFEDDESVPSKTTLSPASDPLASVAFKIKSSVSKVVPTNLLVVPSYCKTLLSTKAVAVSTSSSFVLD